MDESKPEPVARPLASLSAEAAPPVKKLGVVYEAS